MAQPKKQRQYPRRKKAGEVWLSCKHCFSANCIKRGRDRRGKQIYRCKDCVRQFTLGQKAKLFEINPADEYVKDVWDIRRLGIEPSVGRQSYMLNFSSVKQSWLREAAKTYIKYALSTQTYSSANTKLSNLKRFSRFLSKRYPSIEPSDIDRALILDFLADLTSVKISATTKSHCISNLRDFLELSCQNEWLPVTRYLVRREDYPKRKKALPRYIPESVMQQLNEHIDELPESVMRMTLVIMECGMRISELLHLKQDCLLQDKSGDWFLRYFQFKMKKEITIPISRELVRVIQEQRCYIQEQLDPHYQYLFCGNAHRRWHEFNPTAKPMGQNAYSKYLNKLSEKHSIHGEDGKLWRFQSHQFRHTVGTRMINNGVPQHIIQQYLGHESPDMTAVYAQIHDQTMKEEVAKFRGRVVNIAGAVVEPNDIQADTSELQWVKKHVHAQALPNGSCALPAISKGCPHANACLTCTHFRTSEEYLPMHKKELEQTDQIIEKAKANGWIRQVEMNERVKETLKAVISGLEA